jgi:hypothetical protein
MGRCPISNEIFLVHIVVKLLLQMWKSYEIFWMALEGNKTLNKYLQEGKLVYIYVKI